MINEAVRYFGAERAAEMAVYVPTGGGSIDFLALSLGLPRDQTLILSRLVEQVARGAQPRLEPVRALQFVGTQVLYGNEPREFRRLGFGNTLAGYGANFFGPLYEQDKSRAPSRIAALMAEAFVAAAGRTVFQGALAGFKPAALRHAEHEFLRPIHAEIKLDGNVLRGRDGEPVLHHTALNCATVPLNLANILRIFPLADGTQMHVHAGNVSALEMARVFPGLMTGRSVNHLLAHGYDGPAKQIEVRCLDGDEMTPVLDGELFYRVRELTGTLGPLFQMAVP
jgi:hypothetical protein